MPKIQENIIGTRQVSIDSSSRCMRRANGHGLPYLSSEPRQCDGQQPLMLTMHKGIFDRLMLGSAARRKWLPTINNR